MSTKNISKILYELKKANPSDCIETLKDVENLAWNNEFVLLNGLYSEALIRINAIAIIQKNNEFSQFSQMYKECFSKIILSIERANVLEKSTEFSEYFYKFKQFIDAFDNP